METRKIGTDDLIYQIFTGKVRHDHAPALGHQQGWVSIQVSESKFIGSLVQHLISTIITREIKVIFIVRDAICATLTGLPPVSIRIAIHVSADNEPWIRFIIPSSPIQPVEIEPVLGPCVSLD